MNSSSTVHLVLASHPVLSVSVAVRVAVASAHPWSWLRSVPEGAQEGAPQCKQGRDCLSHPRCHKRGDGFHIVSPTTCKRDKHRWAAPRAPSVEGDLAGLPQGKGLPYVHQEYSGCRKDKSAHLEIAKQQLLKTQGRGRGEKTCPDPEREAQSEAPERERGEPGTHMKCIFTRQFPSTSAKALEMETCRPTLGTREIREYGKWKLRSSNLKINSYIHKRKGT